MKGHKMMKNMTLLLSAGVQQPLTSVKLHNIVIRKFWLLKGISSVEHALIMVASQKFSLKEQLEMYLVVN